MQLSSKTLSIDQMVKFLSKHGYSVSQRDDGYGKYFAVGIQKFDMYSKDFKTGYSVDFERPNNPDDIQDWLSNAFEAVLAEKLRNFVINTL